MSGRPETISVIPGAYALSVGKAEMPAPRGWAWLKLSDVAQLATGHTPSRNHPEYWDGGIPWIGIKDAREHHGRLIEETFQKISQLGLANSAARLLPADTVCLSRTASVGYALIMGREMATSQDFVNWVCSPALLPKFLMYVFLAERDSLYRFGKGTTHTTIYFPEVKAFHICLPPRPEQDRIVAKIEELFSDLDAGVAALRRAKANLKRYRAAVLKAAVEGDLTAEWRAQHPDTEPASQLLTRILKQRRDQWEATQLTKFQAAGKEPPKNWRDKYVEPRNEQGLFPLPSTWVWASASEICERVENGNTPPANQMQQRAGEIPFIKVYNLTRTGRLDFSVNPTFISKETHESLLGRSRIVPDDVLMNIVGPPLGKVSIVPDDFPEWNTNQAVVLFRASDAVLPTYIAACLMCETVMFWITRTARATAGQFNISVGNSRLLPFPLPPLDEQKAILLLLDERLSQIDAAEGAIERDLQRAARLRQSILQQAFTGQLVPQDPTDEPARTLLERLRANCTKEPKAKATRVKETPE